MRVSLEHGHETFDRVERSSSCSAGSDLELVVGAVDVGKGHIKEDGLLDQVRPNEAEGAAVHPEAAAHLSLLQSEGRVEAGWCPHLSLHAVRNAFFAGEWISEAALFRVASVSRRPAELEAVLLMFATSRAANHCRCQVDFDDHSLRQVIQTIKLDANVILTDLYFSEGKHVEIVVLHNELVAVWIGLFLIEEDLRHTHGLRKLPARLEASIGGLEEHLVFNALELIGVSLIVSTGDGSQGCERGKGFHCLILINKIQIVE